MGPADLRRYKKRLLEKQEELSFGEPDAEARVARAGSPEGDLIDHANADAEADLQIRVHQADSHLLRAIDEALGRMRRGTYGVCEVCKQPIPKVRLEAVPWARFNCRDIKTTPLPRSRDRLGLLSTKMERVPQVLQFPVIVEGSGSISSGVTFPLSAVSWRNSFSPGSSS